MLFRGLIAGGLSRRLLVRWANTWQSRIFPAPHGLLILDMPKARGHLVSIFARSLFVGWVRMKSGSMVDPWLVHAPGDVTISLTGSVRSAARATRGPFAASATGQLACPRRTTDDKSRVVMHTRGTHVTASAGQPPRQTCPRLWLGHKTASMTSRYTHPRIASARAAVDKLKRPSKRLRRREA